ncbi:uncharacterized protein LOC119271036 [Triticum dicoccoides]|uniref:uncharacterized protein LOC119271036 n=1 Tax=Triticum dicoccoides TaxID=85692 RepID=UPI0018908A66|nr:uncharacterized protein LOC119271036 [Triticum dicoccoides]
MNCEDVCMYNEYRGDCGDGSCEGCYGEDDRCLLLEGLASATNLELISEYSVIFRKDLRWNPMFSKLKTVLFNDWCLTANFAGLLYFLQHTPILEKLALQLPSHEYLDIISSGSYNPAEYFLVSKHLKGSVSSSRSRSDGLLFLVIQALVSLNQCWQHRLSTFCLPGSCACPVPSICRKNSRRDAV